MRLAALLVAAVALLAPGCGHKNNVMAPELVRPEPPTEFDAAWQRYAPANAWGAVWTRPGLDKKIRSMLTIAMLAALGRQEELALHIRATCNTGVTPDEVKEVLLHVAVYAGAPAANSGFAIAKRVYKEIETEGK